MAVRRDPVSEDLVMKKVREDWYESLEVLEAQDREWSADDLAAVLERAYDLFHAAEDAKGQGSRLVCESVRTVMGGLLEEERDSVRDSVEAAMRTRGIGPVGGMELVLKMHVWLERRELAEKKAIADKRRVEFF